MTTRVLSGLGLCLMLGGCAGPLDRAWDEAPFRSIQDRYALAQDRATADPGVGTPNAPAQIHALEQLSVNDAIRIAIANSPRLRRAGYRVDSATGRVTQAGLHPNPSLRFEGESLGAESGRGGETSYRIEQEIVLGSRLKHAREVADADRLTAQAQYLGEEFAVASRVTRAYHAALAARDRLARRQDLTDLAEELLRAATAQVNAGSATEQDRLRAEVVREQAQIELEAARLSADASRWALASAMGLEGAMLVPLSTEVQSLPDIPDKLRLIDAVLDSSSRSSVARIAVQRAQRAHRLARAQATPTLVASAGPRYSDTDNETTMDVGVGVEIPIFDRNQGAIRSAIAERLSAAESVNIVRLELIDEVTRAWSSYETARLTTARYRDHLLPKADRTLSLTRKAYERGKSDYLRLLDAQQVVVESQIAYIDALQRLHESAAELRSLAQTDAPWRESRPGDEPRAEVSP